ncbi:hypothetical protein FACS1894163_07560 [Spirochaetia bacterium]|nr:hypothetical protein FACS1894163_07560 [Spirochaetia bacterium]
MPQAQTMTLHEKLALNMKVIELEKQGKFEEAAILHKTIPIPPYMAKWAKKRFGAKILLETGCNLAEAEKEYGHGWLNR